MSTASRDFSYLLCILHTDRNLHQSVQVLILWWQ